MFGWEIKKKGPNYAEIASLDKQAAGKIQLRRKSFVGQSGPTTLK
jgi:hypothetical protein